MRRTVQGFTTSRPGTTTPGCPPPHLRSGGAPEAESPPSFASFSILRAKAYVSVLARFLALRLVERDDSRQPLTLTAAAAFRRLASESPIRPWARWRRVGSQFQSVPRLESGSSALDHPLVPPLARRPARSAAAHIPRTRPARRPAAHPAAAVSSGRPGHSAPAPRPACHP